MLLLLIRLITTRLRNLDNVLEACQHLINLYHHCKNLTCVLELTQPKVLHCLKPNNNTSPNSFESGETIRQLSYVRVMEAIRIRPQVYVHREDYDALHHSLFTMLLLKN